MHACRSRQTFLHNTTVTHFLGSVDLVQQILEKFQGHAFECVNHFGDVAKITDANA